jgi:hypothetical protein
VIGRSACMLDPAVVLTRSAAGSGVAEVSFWGDSEIGHRPTRHAFLTEEGMVGSHQWFAAVHESGLVQMLWGKAARKRHPSAD